jgi:probable F420-dependent oxidoreductase
MMDITISLRQKGGKAAMTLSRPPLGVGFAIPQIFPDGQVDLATIRRVAAKAEAAGFDSLWTQEQIIGQTVSIEPLTLITYLAAITERVRLGVSVFVLPLRNPVHLAKALASLDVLSGGRVAVGVGLGGGDEAHYAAFGLSAGQRVRRFVECLKVMNALWTEDRANFDGQFYRLHNAAMLPKPVQKPRPPIWFGARTEAALKRAVQYGDGWMGPGSSSAADFVQHVGHLRRFLDEAGRDPATFPISKRVYLAIDDDAGRAEQRLRGWFAHTYGNADMANRVAFWGPQPQVFEQITALVNAGAQHLLLHPVFDYDEQLDALRAFVPS